jgi:hypothetical protein
MPQNRLEPLLGNGCRFPAVRRRESVFDAQVQLINEFGWMPSKPAAFAYLRFCFWPFSLLNYSPARDRSEQAIGAGARKMNKLDRPREIIEYCLKPLALSNTTEEYKEVYRRLEHVIKTLQVMAAREKRPVAIDFSNMRTININEAAHGDDS